MVIVAIPKAALLNCPTHRENAEIINVSSKSPELLLVLVLCLLFCSRMESSCIAKSFYCWGCVEKGVNKSTDTIILSGRRHSQVVVEPHPNQVSQNCPNQLNLYNRQDIDLILEDYSYFETFTGVDPTMREGMPSNYINKSAKCYKNLREKNSYLLVWYVDINQAYLEYVNEESLGKFQISTSSIIEPVYNATNNHNIEKEQNTSNCLERLTLVSKDRINILTYDYDLYESFIGLDPFNRISSDPNSSRISKTARCYRHKNQKEKYILLWNVDDNNCLPEEVSEDELECLQTSNILDLHIDSDTAAMDFVSSLDVDSLSKDDGDKDKVSNENEEIYEDNMGMS
jgi:hypothetical protein